MVDSVNNKIFVNYFHQSFTSLFNVFFFYIIEIFFKMKNFGEKKKTEMTFFFRSASRRFFEGNRRDILERNRENRE